MACAHSFRVMLPVILVTFAGCRDAAPRNPLDRDLGDDDRPLLPPSEAPKDVRLADRQSWQAEWHPFTPPGSGPKESDEAPGRDVQDTDEGPGDAASALRALLDEHNEVAAERDLESLLEFYATDQRDAVGELLTASSAVADKCTELREILNEKGTDGADAVARLDQLVGWGRWTLKAQEIRPGDETTSPRALLAAEGDARPTPASVELALDEDEGFLRYTDLPELSRRAVALKALGESLAGIVEELRTDVLAPADLSTRLLASEELVASLDRAGGQEGAEDEVREEEVPQAEEPPEIEEAEEDE